MGEVADLIFFCPAGGIREWPLEERVVMPVLSSTLCSLGVAGGEAEYLSNDGSFINRGLCGIGLSGGVEYISSLSDV